MHDTLDVPESAAAPELDAQLAAAVELARAALIDDVSADSVGEHVGVVAEPTGFGYAATHRFTAKVAGYVGWFWAVSVSRAPDGSAVTVDETVLLPGDGALEVPEWVPWAQRLQPGDLHPGDLVPSDPDDERLVPGYVESDDPAVEEVAWELGLGRERVLSRYGRLDAAARWRGGTHGGASAMAKHAPAACGTCGFYLPLAGSMRAMFGACANEISPADGAVVAADFGCGAHSQATATEEFAPEPDRSLIYDTAEFERGAPLRPLTAPEVLVAVRALFALRTPPKKSKLSRTKRH